jgi:hypothetical protein
MSRPDSFHMSLDRALVKLAEAELDTDAPGSLSRIQVRGPSAPIHVTQLSRLPGLCSNSRAQTSSPRFLLR